MNQPPRDWDRELADIDKVIGQRDTGAAGQPGSVVPAGSGIATPAARGRSSVALTWFWTLLAVALGVALAVWPYQRACGLQLGFFLGATGLTVAAGFLGAVQSWANRRGLAHMLSLLVLAWAGVVTAGEVLPRTGYARESRTWLCTTQAPTPAPTQSPAPAPPASAPTQDAAPPANAPN